MNEVIARTASGKVAGTQEDSVCQFRGIRYAEAPIGAYRFRVPRPVAPWDGVRPARTFGHVPFQQHIAAGLLIPDSAHALNAPEGEDCLFLNVTTPSLQGTRPVMVYIHGGNFVEGAGSQSWTEPSSLVARTNVVVVTINYRLGALGWLYLDQLGGREAGIDSNIGLHDQIAALRWVRENISNFGGDPTRVTLFGYSAGAWSISALMAAGVAPDLFQRALVMSGGVRCHTPDEASSLAEQILRELDIGRSELQLLREIPAARFVDALSRRWDANGHPFPPIRPVADGQLLPRHPERAIAEGSAKGVQSVVGSTLDEFKLVATIDEEAATLNEDRLLGRFAPDLGEEATRRVISAYREARIARGGPSGPGDLYWAIESDRMFSVPGVRVAEAQCRVEPATYMYQVRWPATDPRLGACHSVDLALMFGTLDLPGMDALTGTGPDARKLATQIQDAWGAFAATGNPNHPGLPAWPPYDLTNRATMIFDREPRTMEGPLAEERAVWQGIL